MNTAIGLLVLSLIFARYANVSHDRWRISRMRKYYIRNQLSYAVANLFYRLGVLFCLMPFVALHYNLL